jgi:hypothetical protein
VVLAESLLPAPGLRIQPDQATVRDLVERIVLHPTVQKAQRTRPVIGGQVQIGRL